MPPRSDISVVTLNYEQAKFTFRKLKCRSLGEAELRDSETVQNWFGEYKCTVNINKAISQNGKEDNECVQVFSNVQNTQTNKATEYMDII